MAAKPSSVTEFDVFSFATSLENVYSLMLNIDLYVFSSEGTLIDYQPVWRGKASVPMTEDELSGAHIFVGPTTQSIGRTLPTLQSIKNARYFEVKIRFHPGQRHYQLSTVPESVWRWWQIDDIWRRNRGKLE